MTYAIDRVVGGEGWAIQQVGPFVLGFWNTHMNEERVHACRRLYRKAAKEHGKLTVFAVYRSAPWSMELVAAGSARSLVVGLMKEFDGLFDAVICVLDGTGILGSILRIGAAAVTPLVPRSVPLVFPSSIDEAFVLARKARAFEVVSEDVVRKHLAELERAVLQSS